MANIHGWIARQVRQADETGQTCKLQPHKLPARTQLPTPRGGRAIHLSAEPLMSRRQVSICTSKPRFMLHISMYSCRCRFMSLLAVASSS